MDCPTCGEPADPTRVYCIHCGNALDSDSMAVQMMVGDQEERAREMRLIEAVREARSLLVLTAFLFVVALLARVVLVETPEPDHTTAYRVPYAVVLESVAEPPDAVPTTELEVPLPSEE